MRLLFLIVLGLFSSQLKAQLSLTAIGANHTISFDANVANVNNGTYTSSAGGVSTTPPVGQLDTDA